MNAKSDLLPYHWKQTVRSFWQSVNWEDIPQEFIVKTSANGSAPLLSLRMSVKQYFSMFPWTGVPTVAAMPDPASISQAGADEKDDTLEDFLDDISNFF